MQFLLFYNSVSCVIHGVSVCVRPFGAIETDENVANSYLSSIVYLNINSHDKMEI